MGFLTLSFNLLEYAEAVTVRTGLEVACMPLFQNTKIQRILEIHACSNPSPISKHCFNMKYCDYINTERRLILLLSCSPWQYDQCFF